MIRTITLTRGESQKTIIRTITLTRKGGGSENRYLPKEFEVVVVVDDDVVADDNPELDTTVVVVVVVVAAEVKGPNIWDAIAVASRTGVYVAIMYCPSCEFKKLVMA